MIEANRGSDDEEEVDSRVARRNDRERGRALNTRANGGRGMMGVSEVKKKEVAVLEKRAQKQQFYDQQKFNWGNNKQSNSQKHFRVSYIARHFPFRSMLTFCPGSSLAMIYRFLSGMAQESLPGWGWGWHVCQPL